MASGPLLPGNPKSSSTTSSRRALLSSMAARTVPAWPTHGHVRLGIENGHQAEKKPDGAGQDDAMAFGFV
jgi:hypothetical protein